jgi:hypothetical protein
MALLAAFEDADALPPEGSVEANRLIKALIQFQAAFMKSDAPAVQKLLREALEEHRTPHVATAIDTFRRQGWTSRTLESVVDYTQTHAIWEEPTLTGLEQAFQAYHVQRADLELLVRTVRQARDRLASQGTDLHAVYAARLRQMPGS